MSPLRGEDGPEIWYRPADPFRIIGNVHYVGSADLTSFLITTSKGHILLDSGAPENVALVLQNIGRLGFDPREVKVILGSHAHVDHVGGIAALRRLTGAALWMSRADAELAARGGKGDPHFADRFSYPPFVADHLVENRKPVTLGGVAMMPLITPGHTKGCTTWTVQVEDAGTRREVVFLCSVTAPDYQLVGNPRHPDAVDDFRQTFRILRDLRPDVFLASHGSFFDLLGKRARMGDGRNPFIDPERWARFLDRSEKRIEEQIAAQLDAVRKGSR